MLLSITESSGVLYRDRFLGPRTKDSGFRFALGLRNMDF